MKNERLLYAMGGIDERYIQEAAPSEAGAVTARKSKRPLARIAALAACMALVFAAALFLSRDNGAIPGGQTPPTLSEPGTPGGEDLYPLTLNQVDESTECSADRKLFFWYDLTDEQLAAVFPGLSLPLTATVYYKGDASIMEVAAYEAAPDGSLAMFSDYNSRTQIRMGPDELFDCVVYDYDAVPSDVGGVSVLAGVIDGMQGVGYAKYFANFQMDGIYYQVRLYDTDIGTTGADRLTALVNTLIKNGPADLTVLADPVVPEMREERISFEAARADPDFGMYLPQSAPDRFTVESSYRFLNQVANYVAVDWTNNYHYINWRVSTVKEYDLERLVSPEEREKYDLSLYSIPWCDSVPEAMWDYIDHPVFRAEDMSLELIRARAYAIDDFVELSGLRMSFDVLYGDVVVSITASGASPEEIWAMLGH